VSSKHSGKHKSGKGKRRALLARVEEWEMIMAEYAGPYTPKIEQWEMMLEQTTAPYDFGHDSILPETAIGRVLSSAFRPKHKACR